MATDRYKERETEPVKFQIHKPTERNIDGKQVPTGERYLEEEQHLGDRAGWNSSYIRGKATKATCGECKLKRGCKPMVTMVPHPSQGGENQIRVRGDEIENPKCPLTLGIPKDMYRRFQSSVWNDDGD